jgi:hypothetical protein
MVRIDENRDSNSPAPRRSSLPTLMVGRPSRHDAASKPVDLQLQPMEVREPSRAGRDEPIDLRREQAQLRKERARLRGEPPRWWEQATGLRTAATGSQPDETGLGREVSAAPSSLWDAARSAH